MMLVVDIGSNTIKCLLGTSLNGVSVKSIYEKSLDRRILATNRKLVDDVAELIADSILFFESEAKNFSDEFKTIVVATSALRDSPQKDEILRNVFSKTSREIKILSGESEARLSFKGAMTDPLLANISNRCVYFDLGGGSLEVVSGSNGVVDFSTSIPVGAVRLTRDGGDYFEISKKAIASSLSHLQKTETLVGAGGAVVAARLMKKKLGLLGAENEILLSDIKKFFEVIAPLSLRERVEKFSISENRADILPAAFACIIELMEFLKVEKLTHTFCNLRYGVIVSGGVD